MSSGGPWEAARPLFVTRKYPPSIGGMQTLAAGVWRALEHGAPDARLIAHGGSNRALPVWLLGALPRVAIALGRRAVDSALTGDALMYALCEPLFRAAGIPNATMIHGADVTFPNRIYRALVPPALVRCPLVIANSQATAEAAIAFGVRRERVSVVRLGVRAPPSGPSREEASSGLRRQHGIGDDRIVLVTLGRLVRRKGVTWFVRNVLPRLPENVIYLVAGDGPVAEELAHAVVECGLGDRVHLLGAVDDEDRERLLRGADIFVQPNIAVPGDMEGFGLVLVEAAMRGTPTVASGIEGILDAVVDGRTGFLVPAGDAAAWVERMRTLLATPSSLADIGSACAHEARALYGEEQMSVQLLRLLSTGRRSA